MLAICFFMHCGRVLRPRDEPGYLLEFIVSNGNGRWLDSASNDQRAFCRLSLEYAARRLILNNQQILWLLFITADDETRLAGVFSSYAADAQPGRTRSMRQSRRASSAPLGISNNQSATDLNGNHGGANTYASGGQGYGMGGLGSKGPASMHSMTSHGIGSSPGMGSINNGMSGMHQQPQQQLVQPTMQSAAPVSNSGRNTPANTDGAPQKAIKAKALYGYTASPDDPNEIGFVKGEILDILDNSGKWFSARKQDGSQGIVPR
jgi:SHO1 osmosensor